MEIHERSSVNFKIVSETNLQDKINDEIRMPKGKSYYLLWNYCDQRHLFSHNQVPFGLLWA